MIFLFWIVELLGFFKRKKQHSFQHVAILFLSGGIGDLIMLSPIIQRMKDLFPNASLTLVTDKLDIVQWNGIRVINKETFVQERHTVDLLVSPTLSLRYIPHLFFVKNWIGYFATPTLQANWKISKYQYNPQLGHYLWRGVYLLQALDPEAGDIFEKYVQQQSVDYPALHQIEPSSFQKILQGKKYLVVGIFSKHPDRQWPKEHFASVITDITTQYQIEKVVLVGDTSDHDRQEAERLLHLLSLPQDQVFNLVGKTSLAETAYVIARSTLFLGVDSGPSHMAYLLAPRSLVIFVTVRPEDRLPLQQSLTQKIKAISPLREGEQPLYSGLSEVPLEAAQKYVRRITPEEVLSAIESLM